MKKIAKRFWTYLGGSNGLLLLIYFIFVVFTFAFVALFDSSLASFFKWFIISVAVGIICCPVFLKVAKHTNIKSSLIVGKTKNDKKWTIFLFVAPFVLFLIKYIIYYPTAFSLDSFRQYNQAINNSYNDQHPVIHTLLVFKLPLLLTGGWIGSISLFQIIVFSLSLTYAFLTIQKYTNRKYTAIAFLFIMLNPETTNIAMFPWKDVSFAIGALLLTTFGLHIYFTSGDWLKKPINIVWFVLTITLTSLFRHNGILFTVPYFIVVIFFIAKKRALIILLSCLLLFVGIRVPLYNALGVEYPNNRQIEMLGVPVNVIGAVAAYAPECLDEETAEFVYRIASKEVWEECYEIDNYNAIKLNSETNNAVIEEYGTARVLQMMFRCIINCPYYTLKAIIKMTDIVYTVSDDYRYFDVPCHDSDAIYDSSLKGIEGLQKANNLLTNWIMLLFPWLFMYVGAMHLLLIVVILAKCKLNKWASWKKILWVLPLFIYNFGTALLTSSAGDSSRFFFYTFLLVPTLLIFLYKKKEEEESDFLSVK